MPKDDPAQHHMFNSEYIELLRGQIEEKDAKLGELEAELKKMKDRAATLRAELGV